MIGSRTNAANPPWRMLVGWSLRSKVIGQEDHGLNFGATGSNAYTSLSARFRSLLGIWVAYIMFTVRICGGKPFGPLLFGDRGYLAGLLEHPTIPVGVIGWPFGGAMNLARAVEYPVQTGRALGIIFKWPFPLTGFISSESGIYCRILIVVAANAALLLVSTCPATFVLGIRLTRVLR